MRGPAHRSPGAPVLFSCPCIADFEFPPQAYGDRIASVYDALISPSIDASTAAGVSFLAELAGDGPALELGVGTGRVALPLATRGVQVHGIDSSEAMVARMRSKPHGDAVTIHIGDFADVAVDDQFRLIYVVFNTVFAILTQADQVRCFRNVAARLPSGGCFVIEAFGPDPTLFDRGRASWI